VTLPEAGKLEDALWLIKTGDVGVDTSAIVDAAGGHRLARSHPHRSAAVSDLRRANTDSQPGILVKIDIDSIAYSAREHYCPQHHGA
jgi:hypothetical protein